LTSRLLFVGNSFVARNDVPGLVRGLAASAGRRVETASIVAGGASLRRHLNAGTVSKALETSTWRHVVLQEQSTLPIKNPVRYHENVRALHALIAAAGAETVLYMTWARRSAPETQGLLTEAVDSIGREIGAAVAPAGTAWRQVLHAHPEITLHAADGSHPTLAGSFLAACVLYGTIFQDHALELEIPPSLKIDPDLGCVLLAAARRALRAAVKAPRRGRKA
jgi:hypothetical protein